MPIIRAIHDATHYFTPISNDLLQNSNLTAQELGVLCYCLSHNEKWEFHTTTLAKKFKMHKDTMRTILEGLECKGFLIRKQTRSNGKFSKYKFTFIESPFKALILVENDKIPKRKKTEPKKSFPMIAEPKKSPQINNKVSNQYQQRCLRNNYDRALNALLEFGDDDYE